MVRSLWTGASGMIGQQANIDTISNNLANVNTSGFKKVRADFEDLLYQTVRTAGTPATEDTVVPVGVQMGHGVKLAATQRMFSQGSLQNTENVYDIAIEGEGFFRVKTYDGSYAYTRDGAFKVDSDGRLVTSNGYWVLPDIIMPEDFLPLSIAVSQQGRVTVELPGLDDPVDVGQMELYRFPNPVGLSAVGENLFKATNASGDA
ncbi:MAG: flagellar basal-body rod protein FlgG, partial [Spirochaetaceae bacterium]|nr:flagellar basal-body rod protein FlgG [Spirochaetaceae bacterium]